MLRMMLMFCLSSNAMLASELVEYLMKNKASSALAKTKQILKIENKINGDKNDLGTPLAWAIYYNKSEIARYLLSQGAKVNKQSEFKGKSIQRQMKMIGTPLHVATINANYEMVELLLKAGADPYVINPYQADSFTLAKDVDIKELLNAYRQKNRLSLTEKKQRLASELDQPVNYKLNFPYLIDLPKAKIEAKRLRKPIFLVVMSNSCRACKAYVQTTLRDEKVVKFLKNDFVVVLIKSSVTRNTEFETPGTPATWVLSKEAKAMTKPYLGVVSKEVLHQVLQEVVKINKKD